MIATCALIYCGHLFSKCWTLRSVLCFSFFVNVGHKIVCGKLEELFADHVAKYAPLCDCRVSKCPWKARHVCRVFPAYIIMWSPPNHHVVLPFDWLDQSKLNSLCLYSVPPNLPLPPISFCPPPPRSILPPSCSPHLSYSSSTVSPPSLSGSSI